MSARLIGRIGGVGWLIHEPALRTLIEIAERETPDPDNLAAWKGRAAAERGRFGLVAAQPAGELPGARAAGLRDGVALLSVHGPIFRYANLFTEFSGACALSDLAHDFDLARRDPRVRAILLDLDTPGGEATGIAEFAGVIRAGAAEKPVVAYVGGNASSAGYWLASAAGEIVVSTTACLGCLGAVAVFNDRSAAAEARGERKIEIVSSQTPGKRPDPATDSGRAAWQAVIDRLADVFLADAARNRGISVEALLAATRGGGLVVGADNIAPSLADRIGGFEETLARLAAGEGRLFGQAPAASNSTAKGDPMGLTVKAQAALEARLAAAAAGTAGAAIAPPPAGAAGGKPGATAEAPAADAPEAAPEDPACPCGDHDAEGKCTCPPESETEAAGNAKPEGGSKPADGTPAAAGQVPDKVTRLRLELDGGGQVADAVSERARCLAIFAAAAPAHRWLAEMAVAEGWSTEKFTAAQGQAEASRKGAAAGAAAAGFAGGFPAALPAGPAADAGAADPEAKLRAEWDAKPSLRAEFGDAFARFLAYSRAKAGGLVRSRAGA